MNYDLCTLYNPFQITLFLIASEFIKKLLKKVLEKWNVNLTSCCEFPERKLSGAETDGEFMDYN